LLRVILGPRDRILIIGGDAKGLLVVSAAIFVGGGASTAPHRTIAEL
jgi:hypothetical protein